MRSTDVRCRLLNYTRLGDPAELVDQTQGHPLSPHDELRVVDESGDKKAIANQVVG
jgi:mycobactin salicyl-AMP ligase